MRGGERRGVRGAHFEPSHPSIPIPWGIAGATSRRRDPMHSNWRWAQGGLEVGWMWAGCGLEVTGGVRLCSFIFGLEISFAFCRTRRLHPEWFGTIPHGGCLLITPCRPTAEAVGPSNHETANLQGPKTTPKRTQNDPKPNPNRPQTDPKPTPNQSQTDLEPSLNYRDIIFGACQVLI